MMMMMMMMRMTMLDGDTMMTVRMAWGREDEVVEHDTRDKATNRMTTSQPRVRKQA